MFSFNIPRERVNILCILDVLRVVITAANRGETKIPSFPSFQFLWNRFPDLLATEFGLDLRKDLIVVNRFAPEYHFKITVRYNGDITSVAPLMFCRL